MLFRISLGVIATDKLLKLTYEPGEISVKVQTIAVAPTEESFCTFFNESLHEFMGQIETELGKTDSTFVAGDKVCTGTSTGRHTGKCTKTKTHPSWQIDHST